MCDIVVKTVHVRYLISWWVLVWYFEADINMASGINIYSELLISRVRIVDINNANRWYQQFELLISRIRILDISNSEYMLIPLAIHRRIHTCVRRALWVELIDSPLALPVVALVARMPLIYTLFTSVTIENIKNVLYGVGLFMVYVMLLNKCYGFSGMAASFSFRCPF